MPPNGTVDHPRLDIALRVLRRVEDLARDRRHAVLVAGHREEADAAVVQEFDEAVDDHGSG